MKNIIAGVIVVCLLIIGVQFLNYNGKQANIYTSVGAALGTINRAGSDGFREATLRLADEMKLDMTPGDITIVEDKNTNRVDIEVKYRSTIYVLFIPIERETVIQLQTTNLGI